MAGWIKMALRMEVGLGPGHIVLDGDPAPPPKRGWRTGAPNFRLMSIVIKRQIDEDATWYGGRPRPKGHCATWGPSSPQKGTTPNFRPMSVVANWLDG